MATITRPVSLAAVQKETKRRSLGAAMNFAHKASLARFAGYTAFDEAAAIAAYKATVLREGKASVLACLQWARTEMDDSAVNPAANMPMNTRADYLAIYKYFWDLIDKVAAGVGVDQAVMQRIRNSFSSYLQWIYLTSQADRNASPQAVKDAAKVLTDHGIAIPTVP